MNDTEKKFYVILHNIRSCYNVGSIFRTADAFGVDRLFLGGYTPNPKKNSAICKTSLGAEKNVDWEAIWHTHKLIERLKQEKVKVIALEQTVGSNKLNNFKPKSPCALVVGNEVKGLSKVILSRVDEVVEIPMLGQKESLNVAVAFGIAAYQISS
jgi:tRNA G18 (ribose-2'-O)-methylase SpoU